MVWFAVLSPQDARSPGMPALTQDSLSPLARIQDSGPGPVGGSEEGEMEPPCSENQSPDTVDTLAPHETTVPGHLVPVASLLPHPVLTPHGTSPTS